MRSPRNPVFITLGLGLLGAVRVCAGPPTPVAPKPSAAKPPAPAAKPPTPAVKPPVSASPAVPAALPDYGGRDSAPLAVADNAPNPLAQAGRALEALLLVLAGVVGVVYALKRYGLVTPGADGKPARIALPGGLARRTVAVGGDSGVSVLSSQALPGGAMLHVVSVAGRTLLLAATANAVTSVAEWPTAPEAPDRGAEADAFEEYLSRADAAASPLGAANARLRSLLPRPQPGDAP